MSTPVTACPDRSDAPGTLSRRSFLWAGALLTGGPSSLLVGCGSTPMAASDGSLSLNAWVSVTEESQVEVHIPRAEMGQGVQTALAMLVAEEMEVPWSLVRVRTVHLGRVYANTALLAGALPLQPDADGWLPRTARWLTGEVSRAVSLNLTGGSTSVKDAWMPLRLAGAAARDVLLRQAQRLSGAPADALEWTHGAVQWKAQQRQWSWAELAQAYGVQPFPPTDTPRLRAASERRLIGRSPLRLDGPAKVDGSAVFGIDQQIPGRKVAILRMAPRAGVAWSELDTLDAEKLPGVHKVLPCPDWPTPAVAVIADSTWQALRAAAAVQVRWDAGMGGFGDHISHARTLEDVARSGEGLRFRNDGDASSHWERAEAAHRLEAVYSVPHLAHAALEPLNATALWKDGRLQLWTGTQSPILARWHAARIADIPIESVTLEVPFLGGGFGRRLESDAVEQVTRLALECPGIPIQLVWTRDQEFQHDVYRPAAACHLRAVVSAGSRSPAAAPPIEALSLCVAAPSVSDAMVRRTLPGWMTQAMPQAPDKVQIEGLYDLPYAIPQVETRQALTATALPVGSWRSVGHSHNAFFLECFLDEIAHHTRVDPVALRRTLLGDRPRHRAVLEAVVRLSEWDRPAPAGRARGVALHASFGAVCAQVAEVSLDPQGRPRVHRISCAVDVGTPIHPDGVRAQMEGAILFGLSAALWGEVPFADGTPTVSSWAEQPIARMADVPEIRVECLPSDAPPEGAGEPGTPPVAPAIANALFRLDGVRRRRLPLVESRRA